MRIRPEDPQDADTIRSLTETAFKPMSYSDGTEGRIVDRLRRDGDLTLSLVAEEDGEIIGHVALSPVTISEAVGNWYGLGPISVVAERQRQGIGSALVAAGLARLREMGAAGVALTGNPAVYGPMGFRSGGLRYPDTAERNVMWQVLTGGAPSGDLAFAPAFDTL